MIVWYNRINLCLLKHDFRYPDAVGIFCFAPWKVPTVPDIPGQNGTTYGPYVLGARPASIPAVIMDSVHGFLVRRTRGVVNPRLACKAKAGGRAGLKSGVDQRAEQKRCAGRLFFCPQALYRTNGTLLAIEHMLR